MSNLALNLGKTNSCQPQAKYLAEALETSFKTIHMLLFAIDHPPSKYF